MEEKWKVSLYDGVDATHMVAPATKIIHCPQDWMQIFVLDSIVEKPGRRKLLYYFMYRNPEIVTGAFQSPI